MPYGFKKENGRWVSTGGINQEEAQPLPDEPAAAPQKPAPAAKKGKKPARPWWDVGRMGNDIRYELNQLQRGPAGVASTAGRVASNVLAEGLPRMAGLPGRDQMLGIIGNVDNAGRLADALIQRQILKKPKADGNGPINSGLDLMVDTAFRALGATPPTQMNAAEYRREQERRNLYLGMGVTAASMLMPGLGLAGTAGGGVVSNALRGGAAFAVNEALGTYLSDNRGSNVVNLINQAAGLKLPGAVGPQDDWIDAANKSAIPNALLSGALGGAIGAVHGAFRFSAKAVRDRRAVGRVTGNRAALESAGLTVPDPTTGTAAFDPMAAVNAAKTWEEADAAMREWIGGTKQAVEAKRAIENPAVAEAVAAPAAAAPAPPPPDPVAPAAPAAAPPSMEGGSFAKPLDGQPLPAPADPAIDPWTSAYTKDAPTASGSAGTVAVPESSPLQEYLGMRYGSTGPAPGAMEASPVQQALGMKALQDSPNAMGLEAGPGRMAPPDITDQKAAGLVEAGPGKYLGAQSLDATKLEAGPGRFGDRGPAAAEPPAAADPLLPPEEITYDPSLPEADVVLGAIKSLSDEELVALSQHQGPIIPAIDQLSSSRQLPEPEAGPNPNLRADLAMAPEAALTEQVTGKYRGFLQSMGEVQLRDLVHPDNSPELSAFVQNNAGKPYEQLDGGDLIDGLMAWNDTTGQVVIPRDYGQQFLPTGEIGVDPITFQFKQNVDSQGVQAGNSLDGVKKWDPAFEGIVDVWKDPSTGKVWVVNGHNRRALAEQLGIGSLPVRYMVAKDAAQARAMGAAANIGSGSGTPFDAAKYFREQGITSPEQMQALGIPMASGKGAEGMALARLPANIFRDAVDGLLPMSKATAMGKANLSEASMQSLNAMVQKDPRMSDGVFRQLVRMGEGLEDVGQATGSVGGQGTLPGMEQVLSNLKPKADLIDRVESTLSRDRTLLNRTARGAERLTQIGNQIDVLGTKAAGGEASDLLTIFRRDNLEVGPLSDLLNQGAAEIGTGAKVGPVAERIVQQFKDLVATQGDMPARTVTDQPSLLAPVAAVEPTPEFQGLVGARQAEIARQATEKPSLVETTLPDELRQQVQQAAIARAIAEGEVRPPETPIPDLPEAPLHDLPAAARILQEAGDTIEPGSPAAQVVADELRLAADAIKRDKAIEWEAEKAARDAADEELLTFDEKQSQGLLGDGYVVPANTAAARKASKEIQALGEVIADTRDRRLPAMRKRAEETGSAADAERLAQMEEYLPKLERQLAKLRAEVGIEPDVMETSVMPRGSRTPIADAFAEQMKKMAVADGKFLDDSLKTVQRLKDLAAGLAGDEPAPKWQADKVALTPAQEDLLQRVGTQRGFRLYPGDGERARASGGQLASSIKSGALTPDLARYEANQLRGALSEGWIKSKAQQKQLDAIANKLEKAAGPEAPAPTLAPAPVKPEPVKLTDDVQIEPLQIGAKLTPAQENAVYLLTKGSADGQQLLKALREGRLPIDQAKQLIETFKGQEGEMTKKTAATTRRAIAKLEEALGIPGAVKARATEIQAEVRANNDKAAKIRRKATEEGC